MEKQDPDSPLNPDNILKAEFDYIAQSAFQANEDRARVTSFYLVSVSSLIAAILGAKFLEGQYDPGIVQFSFGGIFFLLTLLGFLTVVQLARLRSAWYECARAMNQLKRYYTDQFSAIDLGNAFLWKDMQGIPRFKPRSVSFYLVLEVALLSALTFGASVFFVQSGFDIYSWWRWLVAAGAGILVGMVQIGVYRSMLR